jgi:hypothetical protein
VAPFIKRAKNARKRDVSHLGNRVGLLGDRWPQDAESSGKDRRSIALYQDERMTIRASSRLLIDLDDINRSCRPHGKGLHRLGAATLFLLGLGACGEGNPETPGTASGGEAGTSSGGLQGPGGVSGSGGVSAVGGVPVSGGASSSGGLAATSGSSPGDPGVGGAQSTGGNGGSSGGAQSSGGAAGGDIWGGLKNPPVKSAGCGKPATITSATKTIMSGGIQRTYMVDVPADYDAAKPYRLFFASHGQGSTLANITQSNYYDLKTQSIAAKEPAIFVAPLGYNGMPGTSGGAWGQADHAFFDDLTQFLEDNMCIDTTRIFAIGMSMGGMQTYSLSTTPRQKSGLASGSPRPTSVSGSPT